MRYSDDLFHLIKSMEKSEKRYFKVYSSKSGSEHLYYLDLFNAIDQQAKKGNKYNEEALLVQFEGKGFFKNFSVAKAYLYKKILRVMREFYAENAAKDEVIREMLSNIKYLIKRSLYKQAKKILDKAHKLVDEHERFSEKLALIKMERSMINYGIFNETREESFQRLYDMEIYSINRTKEISEYEHVANQIYLKALSTGKGDTTKLYEDLSELNNHPLLQDENAPNLYSTKRTFYHAKSMCYRAMRDYEKGFVYQKKRFDLFEEYPQFIQYSLPNYISALHNLLLSCTYIKNSEDFNYYLNILCSIKAKDKQTEVDIFNSSHHMLFRMYLIQERFDDLLLIVPRVEKGLEDYKGSLGVVSEQNIMFGLSCLYFQIKDYHKAIEWINKLLQYEDSIQQPYIQSAIRVMQMFIYYELNYTDSLPHLLRSAQRYFTKKRKMFELEKNAIDTVKKLLKQSDKKKEEEIYNAFKQSVAESEEYIIADLLSFMGLKA
ncbi:MAG: hypothetical protein J5I47_05050 [Vicingus serpentipes]|nr:hypothetical protein [Vicingus serpentipes]